MSLSSRLVRLERVAADPDRCTHCGHRHVWSLSGIRGVLRGEPVCECSLCGCQQTAEAIFSRAEGSVSDEP